MRSLFVLLSLLLPLGTPAFAACMPPDIALEAVRGRTYETANPANPAYPVKLAFHDDHAASFGSALDGHPGGRFSYYGDCHGRVKVYFQSDLTPGPAQLVLLLRTNDRSYSRLVDDLSDRVFEER